MTLLGEYESSFSVRYLPFFSTLVEKLRLRDALEYVKRARAYDRIRAERRAVHTRTERIAAPFLAPR